MSNHDGYDSETMAAPTGVGARGRRGRPDRGLGIQRRVQLVRPGTILRVQARAPFRVRWTVEEWPCQYAASSSTAFAFLRGHPDCERPGSPDPVHVLLPAVDRWEGRDFRDHVRHPMTGLNLDPTWPSRASCAPTRSAALDGRGLRPSDVVAVGRRSDGRSPAGHLRYDWAKRRTRERHLIFSKGHASPPELPLFRAAGAITDDELMTSQARKPPRRPSDAGAPVDRRRHRSLGQGLPIASGRPCRQARARGALPRVDAHGRQRARGGLDLGGLDHAGPMPSPTSPRSSTSTGSGSAARRPRVGPRRYTARVKRSAATRS